MATIPKGESTEAVAFNLLICIAGSEEKIGYWSDHVFIRADKKWILDTYRECLLAAGGHAAP